MDEWRTEFILNMIRPILNSFYMYEDLRRRFLCFVIKTSQLL